MLVSLKLNGYDPLQDCQHPGAWIGNPSGPTELKLSSHLDPSD